MAGAVDEAARLQRRAGELRNVARELDRSIVHELGGLGGPSTWVGPTAARFDEAVRDAARSADRACDDLRAAARRLDERARELLDDEARRLTAAGLAR